MFLKGSSGASSGHPGLRATWPAPWWKALRLKPLGRQDLDSRGKGLGSTTVFGGGCSLMVETF